MLLNIDLYFTYKYTLRLLLLNKLGKIKNIYNIPKIKKIKFIFYFKKIEDIDDIQIYNSLYLLKFFFGRNAFFTKNKSFFLLGKWYYNFNINMIINKEKEIYFCYYYFLNNILSMINKTLFKSGYYNKSLNIFYFIIKDMNLFSEIKTNLGLFNLNSNIYLNLFLSGINYENTNIFLKNIKIYLY